MPQLSCDIESRARSRQRQTNRGPFVFWHKDQSDRQEYIFIKEHRATGDFRRRGVNKVGASMSCGFQSPPKRRLSMPLSDVRLTNTMDWSSEPIRAVKGKANVRQQPDDQKAPKEAPQRARWGRQAKNRGTAVRDELSEVLAIWGVPLFYRSCAPKNRYDTGEKAIRTRIVASTNRRAKLR